MELRPLRGLRRTALIAFEIDRTPTASDRAIANVCRTSSKAVAAVRDQLAADRSAPDRAAQRAA